MSTNRETGLALEYHDLTKHSYRSVRTRPHFLDWDNKPSPFKLYPDLTPIPLPRDLLRTGAQALRTIAKIGAERPERAAPDLDRLASILYFSSGVTKQKTYPGGEIYFRAAACAGALYPVETYVVTAELDDLKAGVYHFNPGDFSLRRLREGDCRASVIASTAGDHRVAAAPVCLIYTAITWRSAWKYQARSYRYHFWDNGMIAANALALCAAHNLPAYLVMGFLEEDVNKLVGIDGERELSLSLLAIGGGEGPEAPGPERIDLPALDLKTVPLSGDEVDYPAIRKMHRASSFEDPQEVIAWRSTTCEREPGPPAGRTIPLLSPPIETLTGISIEEVVLRRASTRRFARKAMPFEELSVILDNATRGLDADFLSPTGSGLNDLYILANRVDGLEPGAYFFRRDEKALELIRGGDFSERASYLTLEQPLGGDASATIFFMADLDRLLDGFGNRAYRAAQMEAGIIGGRIYIAAYALGRGATGLTFYDDDVTGFFSPHAAGKSCIFVTSAGIPGKRPLY
jgi:SagB-type dehydrogenase family enzyme